jgi:hypothetical protein
VVSTGGDVDAFLRHHGDLLLAGGRDRVRELLAVGDLQYVGAERLLEVAFELRFHHEREPERLGGLVEGGVGVRRARRRLRRLREPVRLRVRNAERLAGRVQLGLVQHVVERVDPGEGEPDTLGIRPRVRQRPLVHAAERDRLAADRVDDRLHVLAEPVEVVERVRHRAREVDRIRGWCEPVVAERVVVSGAVERDHGHVVGVERAGDAESGHVCVADEGRRSVEGGVRERIDQRLCRAKLRCHTRHGRSGYKGAPVPARRATTGDAGGHHYR